MTNPHIIAVDDEPHNLEIISEYLEDGNYQVSLAENGAIAWSMLEADPHNFDVIILDRMMPEMDGMAVLAKIKQHPVLTHCPVILQTARAAKEDILEGMRAGAYYYLAKPFEEEMLFTIVNTAVCERQHYKDLQKNLEEHCESFGLMDSACFRFKTLDQARSLATFIANACPEPSSVVMGLSEMMINAIEHGNLGITYADKTNFNEQGIWLKEVEKRVQQEQYKNKFATLEFMRRDKDIQMIIKDQGKGFDWKPFLEMSIERATDSHGRGIAMASIVSFSRVEFQGIGNEVHVFIEHLKQQVSIDR